GDTSYDLEMALNIVMPSVGVSYGVHTSETLANFNPLSIVNDVSSLHEFLLAKVQWKEAI
ncbi:phosphoglycolate phosphatase, partial [Kingella kingae PYKK081]